MKVQNKWIRAAIPALLLHCSIGTVYCWSIFSQEIADYIGHKKSATEWAFSFAIFFLGMSAAFLGNVVEKDIHRSSLIASICFALGMAGTGLFIWYGGAHKGSMLALIGIYVCYGFIMGIGLGTGYLSPVKTLMLWFEDRKGLATGLAVAGFGAAKAIASPIMQAMLNSLGEGGIYKMFLILACVYFVMMFVGHLLLAKPADWHEPASQEKGARAIDVIKTKPVVFIGIWLMFYINITCGLALISQEKMIIKCIGLAGMAGVLSSVTAVFNAGGRLGFSAWADTMKDRNTVYKIMIILSIAATGLVIVTQGIANMGQTTILMILVLILLFVVNAGYGGGFSNVPTLLSDHYGMQNISAIHGITLSAWGIAGLTGNQLATFIVNHVGEFNQQVSNGHGGTEMANPAGYQAVLYVTICLYVIALACSFFLVGSGKKKAAGK
ncbi:MAG: OFA family MFS transporter [Eubacterium sp.]|nr:OFA family MFS transporter [Eubacterium sp.]MCM1238905.1 OFA family MFS transporter [Lachnospiraceae bacterium]MCM1303456.1 OFA family MFS transporter [Butyrivibrio sp.]MCM1342780.1 OFA family MFS transporter [Muribaculaceae bacterium]MCM1409956.1 OFA family MFS transporter [Lachnospiraceae bacterium]